jgi:hypothetical protein
VALVSLVLLTALVEWRHDRAYRHTRAQRPELYDWAQEPDL